MSDADAYLVFSFEKGAWWGPGGCHYVRRLSQAGRYTRAAAIAICVRAVPGTSRNLGALPELPVRLADVQEVRTTFRDAFMDGEVEPWE